MQKSYHIFKKMLLIIIYIDPEILYYTSTHKEVHPGDKV